VKPHSLVFRLTLLQQVLGAVIIVVFSGSAVLLAARTLEQLESHLLKSSARQLADALDREWQEEKDLKRASEAVSEENTPHGVWFEVFDSNGARVFISPGRPAPKERRAVRTVSAVTSFGARVEVSTSTVNRRNAISALIKALAMAAVPLFIVVFALSRMLASRSLRPLSRIAQELEGMPLPEASPTVGRPSDPVEVAVLAQAFNRLLHRLTDALRVERNFTQDAAHELRTPLTVMSGELEYSLADPSLPDRHRKGLRQVSDQTRGLIELVEALLLLRSVEQESTAPGRGLPPVNLCDVLRTVVREALGRSPDRVADVRDDTTEDEILVSGQAPLLAAGLSNLLTNALKFSSPGDPVRVCVSRDAQDCHVVVEDGGRGLSSDELDRIFDPFFRNSEVRATQPGFGLGLPILRRVARAHGGEVSAATSALGGARFDVRLPVWRSAG